VTAREVPRRRLLDTLALPFKLPSKVERFKKRSIEFMC
jgi:hypothetical protein